MHTIFYLWMAIAGVTGLWAMWTYGLRPLILDRFCFDLEGLANELYALAKADFISLDSPAFTTQKALLEGLIRISPSFGLLQFFLSHVHAVECREDGKETPSSVFETSIRDLQPYVQDKLRAINGRMALLVLRFLICRSPLLMATSYCVFFFAYITGRTKRDNAPADAFQREAYISGLQPHDDGLYV